MSEKIASDSYKSIAKQSKGVYKELGSKFLSFAYPVSSEEEIKTIISEIKKEYLGAKAALTFEEIVNLITAEKRLIIGINE